MTTTSRRLLKGLGVIVVLLVLFILTAPASLVSNQVEEQQNVVQLSGYQGRLMNGQVDQVFVKGLNYQQLSWNASALGLLGGALKADLALDDPKASLDVSVDFSNQTNWSFDALDGSVQVEPLTQLSPILKRFGLSGDVLFNAVGITMDEQRFTSAEGTVRWQSGSVRVSNFNFPLGDIQAELSAVNDSLVVSYIGSGDLQPGGEITLSPLGDYQMTLNIDPAGLPANASWFVQMGKVQADGMVQFVMNGKVKL